MKPIFFIDYDNTIFSHRTWSVPESALQALESLKADGFRVALASGRAFRSSELPEEFHGRFVPDGLVSANGAILEAEGRLIREEYFKPELQRRILDYVTEKGYCLISNYEGTWCTSNLERFKSLSTNSRRKILPEEGEAFLSLYESPRPSFFLADTKEAIADVQRIFRKPVFSIWATSLEEQTSFPKTAARIWAPPACWIIFIFHGKIPSPSATA